MKSKSIAKILSVAGSVAMLAGLATIGFSASADDTAPEKEYVEYSYDFSDPAQLNDFESYYLAVPDGSDAVKDENVTDHWEIKEGKLWRKPVGTIDNPGTHEKNAMLYLNKGDIPFFEAEFTGYRGESWGWYFLGFGGTPGKEVLQKGAAMTFPTFDGFAAVVKNGKNHVDTSKNPPILAEYVLGEFPEWNRDNGDHNLPISFKVKVLPGTEADEVLLYVQMKKGDGEWLDLTADGGYSIIDPALVEGGRIFIQTQNDSQSFDNLVIRPLNADGSRVEKTEEGTTTTDGGAATTTTNGDAATTTTEGETATTTEAPVPQSKWDYEYDFDSEKDLADFKAYWQEKRDGTDGFNPGVAESISKHWEIKDGKLVRKEIVTGSNPGTDSYNAMLYLATEKIPYFEAELTFNHGDSWGWPQLNFGSSTLGEPVIRSGAGVFMSQEGQMYVSRMIYNEEVKNYVSSDVTVSEKPYGEGFAKAQSHTYKIRVVKGEKENETLLSVWVKQADGEFVEIAKDFSIIDPEMAAKGGYIFLQAQNDNVSFDSLKIQKLNADGSDWVPEDGYTKPTSPSTGVTGSAIPALLMLGAGAAFVAAYAFNKKGNK